MNMESLLTLCSTPNSWILRMANWSHPVIRSRQDIQKLCLVARIAKHKPLSPWRSVSPDKKADTRRKWKIHERRPWPSLPRNWTQSEGVPKRTLELSTTAPIDHRHIPWDSTSVPITPKTTELPDSTYVLWTRWPLSDLTIKPCHYQCNHICNSRQDSNSIT